MNDKYTNLVAGDEVYQITDEGIIRKLKIIGKQPTNERFYIAEVVQRNNLEIVHFHWKDLRAGPFAVNKEEVIKHYEQELKDRTELLNQFKENG